MVRLTKLEKELIIADFHTGIYSNNEIAKKYNTSHTTINKMVKELTPKNKSLVSSQIADKVALSQQSFKEVSAVETAVETKTKHIIFFTNSALKNQGLANKKLIDAISINDLEAHSRLTSRNKDTVLGKEPTTSIENNNGQQVVSEIKIIDA